MAFWQWHQIIICMPRALFCHSFLGQSHLLPTLSEVCSYTYGITFDCVKNCAICLHSASQAIQFILYL